MPDLRGTWQSNRQEVGVGPRQIISKPTAKVTFAPVKVTLRIRRQQGRVFYGIKFSKRGSEPIVGVLGSDNTVYLADIDGYEAGTLLARNKLELAYVEAGRRTRVASYGVFKRIR
jgi:hypothetical protein